jgi:guanosine-3',5'-bis(diphosphate) 3'-pyrophosphohydrolase
MKDLLNDSIKFAADAFAGQVRKCSGEAAVLHSLEAAAIVASMTHDNEVIAAAVLHDVVEDAGITGEKLLRRFGKRVTELVLAETENRDQNESMVKSWRKRKEEAIEFLRHTDDAGVKMVFLGDKLSNMRALNNDLSQFGNGIWEEFHQKDPEEHHWYYRTIADLLSDLRNFPAWKEYDRLIREVFQEKGQSDE